MNDLEKIVSGSDAYRIICEEAKKITAKDLFDQFLESAITHLGELTQFSDIVNEKQKGRIKKELYMSFVEHFGSLLYEHILMCMQFGINIELLLDTIVNTNNILTDDMKQMVDSIKKSAKKNESPVSYVDNKDSNIDVIVEDNEYPVDNLSCVVSGGNVPTGCQIKNEQSIIIGNIGMMSSPADMEILVDEVDIDDIYDKAVNRIYIFNKIIDNIKTLDYKYNKIVVVGEEDVVGEYDSWLVEMGFKLLQTQEGPLEQKVWEKEI